MAYLLGTQVVVDLARGIFGPVRNWVHRADGRGITSDEVKVSCMSWLSIQTELVLTEKENGGTLPTSLRTLRLRSDNLFRQYQMLKAVLPVSFRASQIYFELLRDPLYYLNVDGDEIELDFREKFLLATALDGVRGNKLILLDRAQDVHKALGIAVEDPYV